MNAYKVIHDNPSEFIQYFKRSTILFAALTYPGDIDKAPDWVRIIHNGNFDSPENINPILDLALASLEDEHDRHNSATE